MSAAPIHVSRRTAAAGRTHPQTPCALPGVQSLRVLVVGQGYVGLPLAVRAAEAGHRVTGYDSDSARSAALSCGRSPIEDVNSAQLERLVREGSYRSARGPGDLADFDVAVIAVPTPLSQGVPDLSHLVEAGRVVGGHLREGCLVILESTSYPGTTRTVLGPALEQASGLRMGAQFAVGFSPERIDPGNRVWTLTSTPKIVSGVDEESLARTSQFYSELVERVVRVDRCEEAELAKIAENTFRTVNIALMNELDELARDMGVDLRQALEAASTKPFGFMRFDPGPGVGGHCLPIDPVYLSWWAGQTCGRRSRMIDLATQINNARPAYVADRVLRRLAERGRPVSDARVLLLGLAYKPGSSDLRESPAVEVARLLAGQGMRVRAADPHTRQADLPVGLMAVDLVEASEEEVEGADIVVLLTDHDTFDYDLIASRAPLVLDCRGRLIGRSARIEQL